MGRERIVLNDPDETVRLGATIASRLGPCAILALQGKLGAGKTTLVQGLLNGWEIQDTAQSPTFVYLQIYRSPRIAIYHFDLYRLSLERDFILLGFDEFLTADGLTIIEWPERISSLLPLDTHLIQLAHVEKHRMATVTTWGQREI